MCDFDSRQSGTITTLSCAQLLTNRGLAAAAARDTLTRTLINSVASELPVHRVQHCLRQCDAFAARRTFLFNVSGRLIGYRGIRLQVCDHQAEKPCAVLEVPCRLSQ